MLTVESEAPAVVYQRELCGFVSVLFSIYITCNVRHTMLVYNAPSLR